MSDKTDSCPPQRRIDAAAKAAFLAAMREGARREDAAAKAGFSLMGFYGARSRDPAFAAGWREALGQPAAAERRTRAYAERGEIRIAPANHRLLQRRRRRHVRFTAERQEIFLAHFAMTCDTTAAAEAAGVSESTVHLHRRKNPEFAEAYAAALAEGYVHLEAEAVRLRLKAQRDLRTAVEAAADNSPLHVQRRGTAEGGGGAPFICPTCGHIEEADDGGEFDRVMKLLARWDRKSRHPDTRFTPGGRRQRWSFDEAIVLLDKKLRALGVRRGPVPAKVLEDYPE